MPDGGEVAAAAGGSACPDGGDTKDGRAAAAAVIYTVAEENTEGGCIVGERGEDRDPTRKKTTVFLNSIFRGEDFLLRQPLLRRGVFHGVQRAGGPAGGRGGQRARPSERETLPNI